MDISVAKLKILNKNPFIGSILLHLPVIETEEIPTLGVDGSVLYVNSKYWAKHDPKQQMALLMHEAGHLFLGHIWRRKERNGMAMDANGNTVSLFNIAGDYVINGMITQDSRFELPKECLLDEKYTNWSTEQVYNDLVKTMPKMSAKDIENIIKNQICDKSKWGKENSEDNRKQEKHWGEVSKQAAEAARQKGFEPAYLKRFFKDMQPKEDWRNILREFIQPFNDDYSFSPSDRRFLDQDLIIPDIQEGKKLDWIGIAIDTSGSIGDKEMSEFLGEVKGIMSSCDKVKAKLTFCDTVATPFVELEEFDATKIKPEGGGGTDFTPVFKLVKKEEEQPLCLLYFTDGYGSFPKKEPEYPTLWISTELKDEKYPWGKVLQYKI